MSVAIVGTRLNEKYRKVKKMAAFKRDIDFCKKSLVF